ncbi:MAG: hypothetical protein RIC89_14350 [Pseudomonadales bacterium]
MKRNSTELRIPILQRTIAIAFLLGSIVAHGNEGDMLMSADANTATAHQTSETAYLEKATAARNNAAEHRELHRKYIDRGLTVIARHCAAIAKRYDEIAESYDMIAAGHNDLSKDGRTSLNELHGNHPENSP